MSVVGEIGYAPTPIQTKLDSWQAEQPDVTPVWICTAVGAGVANPVPGAICDADAGISPTGSAPMWQFSQVVPAGICELAPTGLVGGWVTIALMPAKAVAPPAALWQATQLLAMPAWFISEPLNEAPLSTGTVATLEPRPTWQTSHEALVGRWFDGWPTMEKLAAGLANDEAALPWHCAQLLVVLCALAWIADNVGMTEKSLLTWHALHCALAA